MVLWAIEQKAIEDFVGGLNLQGAAAGLSNEPRFVIHMANRPPASHSRRWKQYRFSSLVLM